MGKYSYLVTAVSAIVLSTAIQAEVSEVSSHSEMINVTNNAPFIYGDDLVTTQQSPIKLVTSGEKLTLEQRAGALGTVMVTNTGEMFESKMNPEDLAIFEKAINDLNKIAPSFLNEQDDSRYTPLYDTGIEKVIGSDGRTRVTNTTANPYKYIGRIAVGCTGTLVGPKHVLTAGHCVASGSGSWYNSLDFSAGQNGNSRPYGTTSWSNAYTVSEWFYNRDSRFDYGMIILSSAPHGAKEGYTTYSSGNVTVTGYPGDKPFGTLWTMSGSSSSDTYKIYYTLDTAGGQSGSGIRNSSDTVVGIHAYGYSSNNGGTRITNTVKNQIASWISAN